MVVCGILTTFNFLYELPKLGYEVTEGVHEENTEMYCKFKGLVHQKINILLIITYPHVVRNP